MAKDYLADRWRDLVRVFRQLEASGEIKGGRVVSEFVGEQFALPEAVEQLHESQNAEPDDSFITLSACDPLNLAGILFPGHRVSSVVRNRLVLHDSIPTASMQNGTVVELTTVGPTLWNKLKLPCPYQYLSAITT